MHKLEHADLLKVCLDGQNKRYFEAKTFSASEMKLISLLRHKTAGKILTILSQNASTAHKELAHNLGITSQAVTWQMHQLKKDGLIETAKEGLKMTYKLTEASQNKVTQLLSLTGNLSAL